MPKSSLYPVAQVKGDERCVSHLPTCSVPVGGILGLGLLEANKGVDCVHFWGTKNASLVSGEGCRGFIHLNLTVLVWEANTLE